MKIDNHAEKFQDLFDAHDIPFGDFVPGSVFGAFQRDVLYRARKLSLLLGRVPCEWHYTKQEDEQITLGKYVEDVPLEVQLVDVQRFQTKRMQRTESLKIARLLIPVGAPPSEPKECDVYSYVGPVPIRDVPDIEPYEFYDFTPAGVLEGSYDRKGRITEKERQYQSVISEISNGDLSVLSYSGPLYSDTGLENWTPSAPTNLVNN